MSPIKTILHSLWKATAPLRRPLSQRWHDSIQRAVSASLQEQDTRLVATVQALARIEATYPPALGRIEETLRAVSQDTRAARSLAEHQATEAEILMDGVIRELARLQWIVEDLRERIEEPGSVNTQDLNVVGTARRREVG